MAAPMQEPLHIAASLPNFPFNVFMSFLNESALRNPELPHGQWFCLTLQYAEFPREALRNP